MSQRNIVIAYLREIDLPGPPNAAFDTVGLIRFLEKPMLLKTSLWLMLVATGAHFHDADNSANGTPSSRDGTKVCWAFSNWYQR